MQLVLRGAIALTLVGTVGYACYVIYWQKPSVPPTPATSVQNAPEPKEHRDTSKTVSATPVAVSSSSVARVTTMDELVSLAREYVADNPNWLVRYEAYQRSRGEFSDADYESYRDYDVPALEAMLEGGDMLAGQVLAKRADKLGRNKVARHYWHLAAVLGSVDALQKLSDFHFADYQKARHSDDSAAANRAKMDYFVLLDILARRGEESLVGRKFLAQQGISLSAEEQTLVEQRAQSYYQLLLNQRQSRGLGEFAPPQDLTPEEIKKRLPLEPFVENDL